MRYRRDLRLVWEKEHAVASLFLTPEGPNVRCVDAREFGDELVLHYDPEGHCVEAEFLDAATSLPSDCTAETALRVAFEILAAQSGPDEAG